MYVRAHECVRHLQKLVDVGTFYDVYRPLLAGFWPDGLILDGTHAHTHCYAVPSRAVPCTAYAQALTGTDRSEAVAAKGPSAGQSTMIVLFDMLLGIDHSNLMAGAASYTLTPPARPPAHQLYLRPQHLQSLPAHLHLRKHARTHMHAHACMHARTHARMHMHACTHTNARTCT